ncbi:MAG: hypothetical protein ABUS57_09005 [Pseudomonadota bacterium]
MLKLISCLCSDAGAPPRAVLEDATQSQMMSHALDGGAAGA